MRLIHFLMRIMRVIFLVIHGIINIHTLMIEELGIGDHSGVLEVFPKAPGD